MGLGGIKLADYADPRAVSRGVGLAASAKAVADRHRTARDDDTTIISAQVASASGIADYFETSMSMFGDFESRIVDYECDLPRHCPLRRAVQALRGPGNRPTSPSPAAFATLGRIRAAVSQPAHDE